MAQGFFILFLLLGKLPTPGAPWLGIFPSLLLVLFFKANASQTARTFLMLVQVANLAAAAATIFAALIAAKIQAFFLLFFAEVIHGFFFLNRFQSLN